MATALRTEYFTQQEGVSLRDHFEIQLVAQREYFDMRMAALQQALDVSHKTQRDYFDTQLYASQRALDLASKTQDSRFEKVNEFRGALSDLSGQMATKENVETKIDGLRAELRVTEKVVRAEIEDLKLDRERLRGRASQGSVTVAYIISGVGLLIGIVNLIRMFTT